MQIGTINNLNLQTINNLVSTTKNASPTQSNLATESITQKRATNGIILDIGNEVFSERQLNAISDVFVSMTVKFQHSMQEVGGYDSDIFSSLAAKYVEVKGAWEKIYGYSGDVLKGLINALDKNYNKAIESIADSIEWEVGDAFQKSMSKISHNEAIALSRATSSHVHFSFDERWSEEIQAYRSFSMTLKSSIINMGEMAKQYMLEGNTMPKTEDEKNKFDSYISQIEGDSVEKFSASDIKMIALTSNAYLKHDYGEMLRALSGLADWSVERGYSENTMNGFLDTMLKSVAIRQNIKLDNLSIQEMMKKLLEKYVIEPGSRPSPYIGF
ncbi:hypothetical protein ABID52_000629 [Fictibacillus halophilus]|uniref:Uncharacterized protein n=1 Tax=Fictibacillus halophilus TaxID=1610490 RepID=A0ABV2LEM6_9BACL|nr:hypothetical protein [Fictibacillus halophilus]